MTQGALHAPVLITGAAGLPARRDALSSPVVIDDAVVAWTDGAITYAGSAAAYEGPAPERVEGAIVPGFVDCHTHLPFYGWRADEAAARRAGRSYRSLHGEGGIYRSARLLAEATDEAVIEFSLGLLREAAAHGTTTVELKTGYGLSIEAELRHARLARHVAESAPQRCTVTLLACHAIPEGIERDAWVTLVCSELIPTAGREGLADAVDIYVEDIAFTVDDLESVAAAAAAAGLPLRCHVEQLSNQRAALTAVRANAASVDHLNHLDAAGIEALAASETVAVLLPASTFVLGSSPPPARGLIDAGAAVAIASDFNPGTSPVLSMPEVIVFACALYGLTTEEALVAATTNAAHVLGMGGEVGALERGKAADLLVLEGGPDEIPYRPGHNPVARTYIAGQRVAG